MKRRVSGRGVRAAVTAGDIAVVAVVLAAAAVLALALWGGARTPGGGTAAVVTADSGRYVLPLDTDDVLLLPDERGYALRVRVENGRVRFEDSDCPDGLCVRSGWLSRAGQVAACLPAGVTLRVTADAEPDTPDVVI